MKENNCKPTDKGLIPKIRKKLTQFNSKNRKQKQKAKLIKQWQGS